MIPDGKHGYEPGAVPPFYEGLVECKGGCGRYLWSVGYCQKCGEEVAALRQLWDFENHRRARLPVGPWTPGTVAAAAIAIALGVYLVALFAPQVADWICGGPR